MSIIFCVIFENYTEKLFISSAKKRFKVIIFKEL